MMVSLKVFIHRFISLTQASSVLINYASSVPRFESHDFDRHASRTPHLAASRPGSTREEPRPVPKKVVGVGVQQHVDCTPAGTVLKVSWTPFAGGRTGFGGTFAYPATQGSFLIEGCVGTSPLLHLQSGVEYTFDQSDASNWCATRPRVPRLALYCNRALPSHTPTSQYGSLIRAQSTGTTR